MIGSRSSPCDLSFTRSCPTSHNGDEKESEPSSEGEFRRRRIVSAVGSQLVRHDDDSEEELQEGEYGEGEEEGETEGVEREHRHVFCLQVSAEAFRVSDVRCAAGALCGGRVGERVWVREGG